MVSTGYEKFYGRYFLGFTEDRGLKKRVVPYYKFQVFF